MEYSNAICLKDLTQKRSSNRWQMHPQTPEERGARNQGNLPKWLVKSRQNLKNWHYKQWPRYIQFILLIFKSSSRFSLWLYSHRRQRQRQSHAKPMLKDLFFYLYHSRWHNWELIKAKILDSCGQFRWRIIWKTILMQKLLQFHLILLVRISYLLFIYGDIG